MAGMMAGQRPGMIARTRLAHMVHRTGSSAGRYSHSGANAPKVANLAELWKWKAWSERKTSSEPNTSGKYALPAARSAPHHGIVGAVQRRERRVLTSESIVNATYGFVI